MICDHESFFDPLNSDFSLNEQNDFLSTDGLGEHLVEEYQESLIQEAEVYI